MGGRRDYEFSAGLDDREILESLKNIERHMKVMADQGDRALDRLGGSADKAGARIGVMSGVVGQLTDRILDMGAEAFRVFQGIIEDSVKAASGLDTTKASLIGLFGGSQEAAAQAFDFIRQESKRLGVDLSEIAPSFLPKVENLEQFSRIGELVASLARLDPAQGAGGARLALTEALTGDITSLRRRFEIDTGPIKEAQDELGELEGLLVGLEGILKSRGQDFESLGGTAAAQASIAKQNFANLQGTLGEPLLDNFNESLKELNGLLEENEDDFELIAGAIGDVLAQATDLIASGFFDQLGEFDPERILEFIQRAGDTVSLIGSLTETLGESGRVLGEFSGQTKQVLDLNQALRAAIQLLGLFNAGVAAAGQLRGFDVGKRLASGESLSDIIDDARGAASSELEKINQLLAEADQRSQDLRQATEERRESQQETGTDAANSFLEESRAIEAATEAAQEYAEAQAKVNEANEEFDTDKQRAALELQLKQERALLDFQIAAAEKRVDIERKNQQKIEDIRRRHTQELIDAATDLTRDEQDIARDNARDLADLEKQSAKDREQIEENHRRRLEEIKARFEFDAQEAIRANDAIAFLRIQRRAQFEQDQAGRQRDNELEDAQETAQERREKLQAELQREVENARLANADKIADLQVTLQRQLEAQRRANQDQINEQKISEDQRLAAIERAQQIEAEKFNRHWAQKLQDLERNLERELQLIQQYERRKAEARQSSQEGGAQSATERLRQRALSMAQAQERSDLIPIINAASRAELSEIIRQLIGENRPRRGGRQFGGSVAQGNTYLVGEQGPELFSPTTSGFIRPLPNALMFSPATASMAKSVVNQNSNNRILNLDYEALSTHFSPQQISIIKQLAFQLHLSTF